MNIVLLEPEIPHNTGAISRTCAATGTALHLIEPLGFRLDEKHVRRAGLDYWDKLNIKRYTDFKDFLEKNNFPKIYMATTKSKQKYTDIKYEEEAYIMFGKESAGIPEEILLDYKETSIRIPMLTDIRSLNLANSVSVILYEALRQHDFLNLEDKGQLHKYSW
ncbi:tRNA (uridine(34)/cytosine(34)/5-carboxymethylaminomethyluridine(34)-2'-O)-methyltransferase TrmL [Epulopiscium sp. SCG-B10WGA-EpuloA2]|nr:tRNA (uridine(34)/cytosine(34)/5-carboxymethylaminomethyluridine(34)-2'-O)-methyltransferase TrmL [Epulopiscium sp. SCG-C07WGA-EpuloA2]ONI46097.1 tRNA (uridine(34)/cytosine(34)/5-carboxymethylaminomethyluridine(34)-2'-O)-methyltransferase TrmL [Epulopiscium sp. SCG-B10WGA-EpuloA2]